MKRYYVISIAAIVIIFIAAISVLSYITMRFKLMMKNDVTVTLEVKTNDPSMKGVKWNGSELEMVAEKIHKRMISMGVARAVVSANPPNQVVIRMPDIPNKQRILNAVIARANLTFRYVPQLDPGGPWSTEEITDAKGIKSGYERIIGPNGMPVPKSRLQFLVFNMPPVLDGAQLLPISYVDLSTGKPTIYFKFNDSGKRTMMEFTRSHIGKTLAIFVDNKLISAPVIKDMIPDGAGIIEGRFSIQDAKTLADLLNTGSLPVPMEIKNISVKP